MSRTKMVLTLTGRAIVEALSFIVFCFLDLLDTILCYFYKLADFLMEAEWGLCYCSSAKEEAIRTNCTGKILVSEQGESKIISLSSTKLEMEEISDTLFARPSKLSEVSKLTVNELKRIKVDKTIVQQPCDNITKRTARSTLSVSSTIGEMHKGKIGGQRSHRIPRWSDCDCNVCNSWATSSRETLFVRVEGPKGSNICVGQVAKEDVLFIHGFISSSAFWTETLFPNFSKAAKSTYRLLAVDLLGFGRSPKPRDSLYTLRDHLDMIERSVLEPYKVKSFHIVAHSLGCVLAIALAVKRPGSVKSLTLLAPPYYPLPKGVQGTQYIMRRVAPRRVWPPMAFGASIACWYEHISRTICLLICKNHRLWEFLTRLLTRNRIGTFLIEGFCCHTHMSAWHTLHNIICGTASKLDGYLEAVRDRLKCDVNIFHGKDDEVIPIECSHNVQKRIPRASVKVIENKDHITIVVGRQKDFARELEEIWRRSS
uniref:Valacyclovir hydrolase n=1 Tax=Rhizophora mucronata TaxID=61149 RepID=A0A2P2PKX7_RHIMU